MEQWFDSYKGIMEFAISHEVKAYRLYMDLSKMVNFPEIRELCEELAKEELEHKVKLEKEIEKRGELVSPVNLSEYNIIDKDVGIVDIGSTDIIFNDDIKLFFGTDKDSYLTWNSVLSRFELWITDGSIYQ